MAMPQTTRLSGHTLNGEKQQAVSGCILDHLAIWPGPGMGDNNKGCTAKSIFADERETSDQIFMLHPGRKEGEMTSATGAVRIQSENLHPLGRKTTNSWNLAVDP